MFTTLWKRSLRRLGRRRSSAPKPAYSQLFSPHLETLTDRIMPSVTALFSPSAHTLTVTGDLTNNNIVISRDAAGVLRINGGAVRVQGGSATVANTQSISVFGLVGNDSISLDESSGALPMAQLFGGAGNDTLTGGSGADMLFGEGGSDTLLGKGGADRLFGGAGNDTLTGGVGDDQVFGEAGNDRMIWNPGEGSDINEGGIGADTVAVEGGNGAEVFTVVANGARVRFDRISPAPFFLDIGTSESLVVNMNGGDDVFSASNGLASLISLTVDGGTGNDSITGGDGADTLFGGDGSDLVNGGRGNDVAFMGDGDDTFVWNPGDGSDLVEGQAGADRLQFNASNANEKIDISANGQRVRLFRDVGNVTMDVDGTEQVNIAALGGTDSITIGDLKGTAVTAVNLDLSVPGSSGDSAADSITVTGTNGADTINVVGQGTSVSVLGMPAQVNITGSEGANDSLTVNALDGDDGITASTLPGGIIKLTVDGGAGKDMILGSQGADMLLGGNGADFIVGNQGNDIAIMGAGDDVFQWNPGDGSDTVEGQEGADKMLFFGANINENFDVSANGSRVRFFRDVGNVTMDLNGTERIELRTLGGADNVVVNDLTGTDLNQIELALKAQDGGGDGQADSIIVNGTQGADSIVVNGDTGGLRVAGLAATITIFDQEPTLDRLTINGLGGNDVIDARSLKADTVPFLINGGDGDDTITGSDGSDLITGGRGNDVVFMGPGDDTFVWNPGDGSDTVDGQAGTDFLVFNGANISEKFDISANGTRARLTRDIAAVTMDLNDLEVINVNALGGADTITVNDLSGTAVTEINLGLSSAGVGDGQVDTVIINGTTGDDVITVVGDAAGISIVGLAAQVNITGAEPTDRLIVNALAGDDVVESSGLTAGVIQFSADGGEDDDILVGGVGRDTLTGGAGDDVLIGNGGLDILDGGPGNNTLIP